MTPIRAAVQRTVGFAAAVGDATIAGAQMLFGRVRAWGVMLARTKFDYRGDVGDVMRNSAVASVLGWLARNFPDAPVQIIRDPTEPDAPVQQIRRSSFGPGFMLHLLENPNEWYSGVTMLKATILDYYVHADAYWIKQRNTSGRVQALWWVPSTLMDPRWPESDPTIFISHYEYRYEPGRIWNLRPEDVVHFRDGINPNNVRKGRSRFESLWREIFTDDEASNFTASLLHNLGVPGVIIAPANTAGPLRGDPEKIKKDYMEKFSGDKRGEPMVMTGPTEVKVLSWNPQQMDLRSLRKVPEERISGVVGVAAVVAGLGAGLDRSTFTNYGEARRAAYEESIIPEQRGMAATLEVQLLPEFVFNDKDLEEMDVRFDWTQATAMQQSWEAVWRRAESAARNGLVTVQDFQRATKQPVDPGPEVYLRPMGSMEVVKGESREVPGSAEATAAIERRNEARFAWHVAQVSSNGHKPELAGVAAP